MDQPAFHRRGLKNVRPLNDDEKEEKEMQDEQEKSNELLNNRRERIDKTDSDQPAFLRKIMD
jgi:cell division protein FtsZ